MHPAQIRPLSPFSRGSCRLQVAEEQLWDTPHRPGMGMCPRGRCPRPAEGGWLCVQGGQAAQGWRRADALTERMQGSERI